MSKVSQKAYCEATAELAKLRPKAAAFDSLISALVEQVRPEIKDIVSDEVDEAISNLQISISR